MANFSVKFFSNSLRRRVSFEMFLPNDVRTDVPAEETVYTGRGTKVLFLLHGYTGMGESWGLEEIAQKYNFAMVMPSGENAFYLDGEATGHQYCTYVGAELVEYIRHTFGLAQRAEDTFIMGLSMGGFGALHTALAFPDTFGKAAAMSSALIVHEIAHMQPGGGNDVANYAYYHACFGDLETVETRGTNPEVLAKRLVDEGRKRPELFLCCGTEDFLLPANRQFHEFLNSVSYPHVYYESKGAHDSVFWNEYQFKAADWLFQEEK